MADRCGVRAAHVFFNPRVDEQRRAMSRRERLSERPAGGSETAIRTKITPNDRLLWSRFERFQCIFFEHHTWFIMYRAPGTRYIM